MLELRGITKRFGAVAALTDVSLRIEPGEVHGLLGENGAGKSTLMHVLFGLVKADSGTILRDGVEVRIGSPRAAQGLGIGMVHQHFKLVPTLSVAENLALSLHASVRAVNGPARGCMEQLHWEVPLGVRIGELSVGQQQRVEIIKALLVAQRAGRGAGRGEGRTLILDEPTAVLTPQETGELFGALESLKTEAGGNTAIVFISHKLAEVRKICEVVTILRRGKVVHTGSAAAISASEMTEKMVGAAIELPRLGRETEVGAQGLGGVNLGGERGIGPRRPRRRASGAGALLRVEGVTSGRLMDASLEVKAGEIVGVAGVDGNGQSDLVQAIVGGQAISAGKMAIAGEDAAGMSIRERGQRLCYIAEDRHRQALVLPMTVQQNLLLKDYREPRFSVMGWLRFGEWRKQAWTLMEQFDIRARSINDRAGQLSGGNQQKVVLARELYSDRKSLVIAVNPTRGLDVGATAFVMRELLKARGRGAGVLLVHSDLDELLAISDRVLVIFDGRISESGWPADTKEGIGRRMLGVSEASAGAEG